MRARATAAVPSRAYPPPPHPLPSFPPSSRCPPLCAHLGAAGGRFCAVGAGADSDSASITLSSSALRRSYGRRSRADAWPGPLCRSESTSPVMVTGTHCECLRVTRLQVVASESPGFKLPPPSRPASSRRDAMPSRAGCSALRSGLSRRGWAGRAPPPQP
jgi:hypothetical protein